MARDHLHALSLLALAATLRLLLRRRHLTLKASRSPLARAPTSSSATHSTNAAEDCHEALHTHLSRYMGEAQAAALIDACRKPPALTTLRVNCHITSRHEALHALTDNLKARGEAEAASGVKASAVVDDVISLPTSGPFELPLLPAVVLVDRRAGEALLRGADVFAQGVIAATGSLKVGDPCSVIVDDPAARISRGRKLPPGLVSVDLGSRSLHVGNGTAVLGRVDLFGREAQQQPPTGVAVRMEQRLFRTPALNGVLPDSMILQNLPSAIVSHVLDPRPGQRVLDLCAAPGGKATHLATLMLKGGRSDGSSLVLACDRSAARLEQLDRLVARLHLQGIVQSRCLDATRAAELLPHESFDRILLDPPCSALGVRPRLRAPPSPVELESMAAYQRTLIRAAVPLLRPGGTLVYSTCTTNPAENEEAVAHVCTEYPELALVQQPKHLRVGGPGLSGCGLDDAQRALVQRFDPTAPGGDDFIGFFIACFRKMPASSMPDPEHGQSGTCG